MYTIGYHESNVFGPAYNRLYEYKSWEDKIADPELGDRLHDVRGRQALGHHAAPGRDVALRRAVHRRRREVHLGHHPEQVLWLADECQSVMQNMFGGPDAYKVTGPHEITVDLPAYSTWSFSTACFGAFAIMPEHAYKDIKPEAMRSHTAPAPGWAATPSRRPTARASPPRAPSAPGRGSRKGSTRRRKAYKYVRNESYWKPHTAAT